jgi:hypothetical protein
MMKSAAMFHSQRFFRGAGKPGSTAAKMAVTTAAIVALAVSPRGWSLAVEMVCGLIFKQVG